MPDKNTLARAPGAHTPVADVTGAGEGRGGTQSPSRIRSVCHLHNSVSDHLVTQQEPRLEHLGYHVLPKVLIIDVHNGVVLFRVKWLALGLDLRDSQLLQASICSRVRV